uniref:Secreted protein n=1 Tax=Ixodes ricinus TaxID=34613 RepID=A0A147BW06_IXORI
MGRAEEAPWGAVRETSVSLLVLPVLQAAQLAVAVQEAAVAAVGGVFHVAVGAVGRTVAGRPAVGGGRTSQGGPLEALGKVGVLVEVPEEEPEHDGVEANPPHEAPRVVAVRPEQQLEGVHEDGDELHNLDGGHVLLPPEVLGHVGPDGRQAVVEVHQDVHEAIDEGEEGAVASRRELDPPPDAHGHHAMVDDVQRRDVSELLAQHKEYRVDKLDELGDVVPPGQVGHEDGLATLRVVNGLALPVVVSKQAVEAQQQEDDQADGHHEEVVPHHDPAQLHRLPVLHQRGPQHLHQVGVRQADGQGRPWALHEQPLLDPGISALERFVVKIPDFFQEVVHLGHPTADAERTARL